MMRTILLLSFVACSSCLAINCEALAAKYDAPDPETKTMAQISRWIERKVSDDPADAKDSERWLIAGAADNPNKEQVAGK